MQLQWQPRERKAAMLALVSPLIVAIATACSLIPALSIEALLFTPFIAFGAYASLLFFVLPTLALLKKLKPLRRVGFSATVSVAGTLPWFMLYLAFFATPGSAKYGGTPGYIILFLASPLAFSFLVSYLIYPQIKQSKLP